MIILWTDALVFLLCFMVLACAVYLHGKEHIRRPLQQIGQNKTGMVSLTVLLFFVGIGLLDCIHYQASGKGMQGAEASHEIISLLDIWATPLREHGEKTYSVPFALTLYSKEMMATADGAVSWGYPRLVFGGRHVGDPKQHTADAVQKTITGLAQGLGWSGLIALLFWGGLKLGGKNLPAHGAAPAVSLTVLALFCAAYALCYVSQYYHVLGTDKVGEDVLYQAIKSIRTGLIIGTLTTLIMLPLAVIFGILAGFFRGWIDDLIQYAYTTLNSIPSVLLIAASILMVQVYMANHEEAFTSIVIRADMRLLFLCMILGVTSWTGLCRLLRAETLKLREMEYVQAAYALGVKPATILIRHILPNVMHIVLISVVLDFSSLVLAEAVLSYINIGVDPTTYSWGNMINGARLEMAREPMVWWSLSAAFIFMLALVLAANLLADTVQQAFDPRRING
ncbi:MAG: ABC transporter permease [Methylovulum miyakonense]|uniref:ABC transporter permease n=1 Tax=Methylovulum miyakonense TaxID=645578 RepID=UPI003BB704E1